MRKQGEYIIDERLKFKKGLQKEFITQIKKKSNLTWNSLAKSINLSEHTLRVDWQKERTTMPLRLSKTLLKKYQFKKWEEIQSNWIDKILPGKWGQLLSGSLNKKKINIPQKSEGLSEIFGVILGDGHLERKTLTITGNSSERKHYVYLSKEINKLFEINSRIIKLKNQNAMQLKVHSVELIKFLLNNNMKVGNKIKNKASLPKWIFEKEKFMYGALRGLFDTDGGIYYKQKNYKRAMIEFQTHSPYIRENLIKLIKKIGFISSKSTNNVRIQNQDEIHKFFRLVGSSNPKNIVRYKYFIEKQNIPLKEKLNKEIVNFKIEKPFKSSFS